MAFPQLPKSNELTDGDGHLQFGDNDTFTNPPGFNPGDDNSQFNPQPFGRGIITDADDSTNEDATGRP